MAQIMNSFGVDTTLLVRSVVLRGIIDDDIREVWKFNSSRLGLKTIYGSELSKVEKLSENLYRATLTDGSTLETEFIL